MNRTVSLGSASVNLGEKTSGHWKAIERDDGEAESLPVLIINGSKSGPTVWLSGCHHGDEVSSALAVLMCFNAIEPKNLRGSIIAIPVSNPSAFWAKTRASPHDWLDMERCFPGNPNGAYTERLCHALQEQVVSHATYLIDLHAPSLEREIVDHVFFDYFTKGVRDVNKEMAETCVCKYATALSEKKFHGGIGLQVLQVGKNGIPSIMPEGSNPESLFKSVMNVLVYLKMLKGKLVRTEKTYLKTLHYMKAKHGGMFMSRVKLGDRVSKDQIVGKIVNMLGEDVELVKSPVSDGIVITMRTFPIVRSTWERRVVGTTSRAGILFEMGEI